MGILKVQRHYLPLESFQSPFESFQLPFESFHLPFEDFVTVPTHWQSKNWLHSIDQLGYMALQSPQDIPH